MSLLDCRTGPEGEKACRAIQLGTDVSTLPLRSRSGTRTPDGGRTWSQPPNYVSLQGIGHELQCCVSCHGAVQCECGYPQASSSVDCSDPRYSDVGYAELGGDYYGACEDREGSFVCAVGEKDGKVVAVFGICWD